MTLPLHTYYKTLLFSLVFFLIKRCVLLHVNRGVFSSNNTMLRFLVSVLVLASCKEVQKMAKAQYTVDSARACLVRQEDTIIFALIERAKFPLNSPTYNHTFTSISQIQGSLLHFFIRNTEAIQSKVPLIHLSRLLLFTFCFCSDFIMVCCRQVDTLILKKFRSSQKIYLPRLHHITPPQR